MGQTPRYQLPYVEASDQQTAFPAQNKDAMEKVEAQLYASAQALEVGIAEAKDQASAAAASATNAQSAASTAAIRATSAEQSASRASTSAQAAEASAQAAETSVANAVAAFPHIERGRKNVTIPAGASNAAGLEITFTQPFLSTPAVIVSMSGAPGGSQKLIARSYNSTSTGFKLAIYTGDATSTDQSVTLPIDWIAVEL